jgi:hypothetical protein
MNATYGCADLSKGESQNYTRVSLSGIFCALAVLVLGFALQISHGFLNLRALIGVTTATILAAAALTGPRITLLVPFSKPALIRRILLILLVVYFTVGVVGLRFHHPSIDVIIMENDSVRALLHGINPYERNTTHQDIYTPEQGIYGPGLEVNGRVKVGFPYPPLTILWILPGYLLGDVRYSFLIAVILTALIVFYSERGLNGLVAALLILFIPDTPYILSYGWTEPLMVMILAATVLTARRAPRLLPVALGLFFASKQYSFLAVPLAAMLIPRFSWKTYLSLLARACAVAAAVTLPFLLWDPRGFWWSLVGFRLVTPLRLDALSFSALLAVHGFHVIPQWAVMLAVIAAISLALKKAPRTPAGFAASLGLVSLIFFVLNIAGFCNYYFFCAGALCLGLSGGAYDLGEKLFAIFRLSQSETPAQNVAPVCEPQFSRVIEVSRAHESMGFVPCGVEAGEHG